MANRSLGYRPILSGIMLSANGTGWQSFTLGVVVLVAIVLLIALHDVTADVGVPIISAVIMGGIGQANGYRNGQKAP